MEPKFGDVVAIPGSERPWVVLGPVAHDFIFLDDVGEEHHYKGGLHWAVIRLGPANPGSWDDHGMTMGQAPRNFKPYVFPIGVST